MGYKLEYAKQAQKDARLLEQAGLDAKAKKLLSVIKRNPFEPPWNESGFAAFALANPRPVS